MPLSFSTTIMHFEYMKHNNVVILLYVFIYLHMLYLKDTVSLIIDPKLIQ